jgi:chromosome segregation ATPase
LNTALAYLGLILGGSLLPVAFQWWQARRAERATAETETDKETAFRHQHGGTVASSDAATVFAEMGQLLERYKAWLDEAEARARNAEGKVRKLENELDEVRLHVRDQDEIIRKMQIRAEELQRRCEECMDSLKDQGFKTERKAE